MFNKIKELLGLAADADNQNEGDQASQFNTLGKFNLGIGGIGPDNRTDIDPNVLRDMYQRIANGEFNAKVNSTIPVICVDGRTDSEGKRLEAPSAAGGTLSIVYGCDLGNAGVAAGKNEMQLTTEIVSNLNKKGYVTSVHGDNHSSCGCGACAKVKNVYQHIIDNINNIVSLTGAYGIEYSDTEKSTIVERANQRLQQSGFFSEDRAAILQAARDNGASYEELVDAHNELGVIFNTRPGTTVDRAAIRDAFGPQYDMFVVDIWAFGSAAKEFANSGDDQNAACIVKAIAAQNVATASVLGHASLPIIPIA